MRKKSAAAIILSVVLAFCVFCLSAAAAVHGFETQFDHSSAEKSWLTDLVIKENMDTVAGLGSSVVLKAQPEYPYTETPQSFREKTERYCEVYSITPSTPRASYVFIFEFLNANASSLTAQVSDEAVRDYLENAGVVYPSETDTDDLVFAKALYTAMVTGAYNIAVEDGAEPGISLDKALIKYLTSLSGLSEGELAKWAPKAGIASVDDYILAASRLLLWTNGYDVSVDSDEEEIYRLTAVMTLNNMGISVSSDSDFETIKAKYTAAMLGKAYSVDVDPDKLTQARENSSEAFYMLQLIGKKYGLSIREDRYTYEDAFKAVAANTDVFDLEEGEFYADIYRYTAPLRYRSSYIWVYPTAYLTGNEDAQIVVSINDSTVKNNYFNRVQIDPELPEQLLKLVVDASVDGERSVTVYYITVVQGDEEYVPAAVPEVDADAPVQSSATVMSQILAKFGLSPSILSTVDDIVYSKFPSAVRSVLTFMAPTFSSDISPVESGTQEAEAVKGDDSYFVGLLDKIGNVVNSVISGIDGLELGMKNSGNNIPYNFVTVE